VIDRVVEIDGGPLRVEDVVAVAREGAPVRLTPRSVELMLRSRAVVEDAVREGRVEYGITTGFGALSDVRVPDDELEAMQLSLVRSHAAGVGKPLEVEVVRAMLLLRARTLATGYSGVRPLVAEGLVEMLNRKVHPVVPEQGSVGSSGDLAQLAHLALPLVGEGEAVVHGRRMRGAEAMGLAGLEPIELSYKEGLALVNGTEGMLAIGCLALTDAETLARTADVVCAMTIEGLHGTDRPFDPRLHALRPHPGQQLSAENLRRLLAGSPIVESHRHSDHAVQDAYSLRCAPQVHGACRDVISYARGVFERELASVADNPLVFSETGEVLTNGNFHGEPLGFALDFLAQALAELGSISERRSDRMLDPTHSEGLPPFLTERPGLGSGFMLAQYTQAALVAENRLLASPATVDTIPTSGTKEDHVAMGWNAAIKLRRVIANLSRIMAIEAMCAAQSLELREPDPAPGTAAALAVVREHCAPLTDDRVIGTDIEELATELVESGRLADAAAAAIGGLR